MFYSQGRHLLFSCEWRSSKSSLVSKAWTPPPPQISRKKGVAEAWGPDSPPGRHVGFLMRFPRWKGSYPGLRPRWLPFQIGWIGFLWDFQQHCTKSCFFVFFVFFFAFLSFSLYLLFLFLCEQIDTVVFWRFGTMLLKTSFKIQHVCWGGLVVRPPFCVKSAGAPEAGGPLRPAIPGRQVFPSLPGRLLINGTSHFLCLCKRTDKICLCFFVFVSLQRSHCVA